MSSYDDEAFLKDWEATQRSRHLRLLEEVKREYRSSRRTPVPAEATIDLPHSLKIPRVISRKQVKPQGPIALNARGAAIVSHADFVTPFPGLNEFQAEEYDCALPLLRPLAEQGHAEAQCMVGNIYHLGLGGVVPDLPSAIDW